MFTKLAGYYLTPSDNWLLALIQAEPQKKSTSLYVTSVLHRFITA